MAADVSCYPNYLTEVLGRRARDESLGRENRGNCFQRARARGRSFPPAYTSTRIPASMHR